MLVFSSGTTGLPKAVRHTHRSIGCATAHWCTSLGLGPDDRFQVATPPSHILGLLNLLAAASAGATVRLHRRFDLDEVLRRIESRADDARDGGGPDRPGHGQPSATRGVRPVLAALHHVGGDSGERDRRPHGHRAHGVRWLPAYGASEVPVIAVNPVGDPAAWRLDSAGLPPDGVELRVADLDTGAVLAAGEIGEIQVLSPSVMAGYLPDEATADAFADGWYRTGDVGWLEPEGWVHLTDRSKEMIKVNGFQVAPAEIEAVLHGHPAVRRLRRLRLARRAGRRGAGGRGALDPGRPVTDGELAAAGGRFAGHLQAAAARRRSSTPSRGCPSGKVLRRTLRDEWTPASPHRRERA